MLDSDDPCRVLVVDDNHDAADSLAQLLNAHEYQAEATYDGEGAIECAKRFNPHVVVLDLAMPGLNGYDTAERLKSIVPRAKIIFMSGYKIDTSRMKGQPAHHLLKPVDPQLLERIVHQKCEDAHHCTV